MAKNPDAARVPTSFSPGPQRVESGEVDETFVHRPVGFAAQWVADYDAEMGTGKSRRASELGGPLLWEGDQA